MNTGKPLPPITPESKPYWDGCNEGRLMLQRCNGCAHWQFYPRLLCSACGSRDLAWASASGRGSVRTFTIVRRAVSSAFDADVPYVVALIGLEEGPTMMSNVVQCDAEAVRIGMPVTVCFEQRTDTVAVPQFRPT